MSRAIVITINPDETTVAAYCLKTDIWQDFLAFKSEAIQAIKEGNLRKANRYLRAALVFLFSHLEGFVHDVETSRYIPKVKRGSRLCDKTRNISFEARKYGKLPKLNFRLGKHLRDLIAHPGIEIDFSEEFENKLDTVTVFEHLDLNTLKKLETQISFWIDGVSVLLNVERFTDTEELVKDFAESFGDPKEVIEI